MPLAFPSDGPMDSYRLGSISTGGYYTNDESEVESPSIPQLLEEPSIVIDPALLGDVQPRPDAIHDNWGHVDHSMMSQTAYHPMSLPEPLDHQPYMDAGPFDPQSMMQPDPSAPFFTENPAIYPPFLVDNVPSTESVPHGIIPHPELKQTAKAPKRKYKRRRKPKDGFCSFCKGTEQANKQGVAEQMVSCWNCGRSGHPSCLQIEGIGDVLQNYEWNCMECKTCEVCRRKGKEDSLLFCDMCDRGWHTYCLEPQLQEPPKGTWACPTCVRTPVDGSSTVRRSTSEDSSRIEAELNAMAPATSVPPDLEDEPPPTPAMDVEVETPVDSSEQPTPAARPKKSLKLKTSQHRNPPPDFDEDPTPLPTPARRPRITVRRGPPSPPAVQRVRLKLSKTRGRKSVYDDDDPDPFEGVLQGAEADTSKTTVTAEDKSRFEKAKAASEMKAGPANTLPHPSSVLPGTPGPSNRRVGSADPEMLPSGLRPTRSQANLTHLFLQEAGPSRSVTPLEKGKEKVTASKPGLPNPSKLRVRCIRFGEHEIDTWYDAPFPEEYASVPDGMLWICEFCLKYMKSRFSASRHRLKCKARHPPGDEIYREDCISVFEVDGRKNKIYCQNLCLLSKMFLDHKSLFYDVEPFLFYVMTETDDVGARFIGYFSKEKRSTKEYNLSCIMTLPVRQRRGWGNFLIDFSYLLSKKEGRVGGPETPLSALGAISYKRYWTLSLMYYLRSCSSDTITLQAISAETSMTPQDVFATLLQNLMITVLDDVSVALLDDPSAARPSPARGRPNRNARASLGPSLARRNVTRHRAQTDEPSSDSSQPITLPRYYKIHFDREAVEKHIASYEARNYVRLEPEKLKWTPFLLVRSRQTGVEIEPPVTENDVLVESLAKKAEEEEARLAVEIPQLEERRRLAEEARAQVEAEEAAQAQLHRSESPDETNDSDPKSRPLSVTRSIGRSQSLRHTPRESSSRLLRTRHASPPPSEGETEGSVVRASRRLRERPAASGTTALWRAEPRRRNSDGAASSSEDDHRSPSSRTRLRIASSASQTTSSHHADGSGDEVNDQQSDTDDLSSTTRARRSGRQSLRNGNRFGHAVPAEESLSPRKRRRIESPPDHESDEDSKPQQPTPRKTKSMPLRKTEEEATPLRTRLRVRTTVQHEAEEEKTARRSLRSRGTTNGVNGASGHASEEHDASTGDDEDGTEHPPIMEFDSTGSLSSAGPEMDETTFTVTKNPMSTRSTTASRRPATDALVLGDGEHEQEEDAEGEEDWD